MEREKVWPCKRYNSTKGGEPIESRLSCHLPICPARTHTHKVCARMQSMLVLALNLIAKLKWYRQRVSLFPLSPPPRRVSSSVFLVFHGTPYAAQISCRIIGGLQIHFIFRTFLIAVKLEGFRCRCKSTASHFRFAVRTEDSREPWYFPWCSVRGIE